MNKIADLSIVIAAGGSSRRFGSNKLFEILNGTPVFIQSLLNCSEICDVANLILVAPDKDLPTFKSLISEHTDLTVNIVPGGETRMHSVLNGLKELPNTPKVVAVHDAARPLAPPELFEACYRSALIKGSAVAAKTIPNTIKQVDSDGYVKKTLNRDTLAAIETPQTFFKNELIEAYEQIISKGMFVTDDAAVMEEYGKPVFIEKHSYYNIKITFQEDIKAAEAFLSIQ